MKKIGYGWQYTAYDVGNGRVYKKSNSWLRAFWSIVCDIFPFTEHPLRRVPFYIAECRRKAHHSFEIIEKGSIPLAWLAHPKRIRGLDFEQDRVKPLGQELRQVSEREAKQLIDLFVAFNKQLLRHGVIEKSFNITQNFGLDATSKVVLIDIGELIDDPKRIIRQCTRRAWAARYVAGKITNRAVRQYFVDQMDRAFGS